MYSQFKLHLVSNDNIKHFDGSLFRWAQDPSSPARVPLVGKRLASVALQFVAILAACAPVYFFNL